MRCEVPDEILQLSNYLLFTCLHGLNIQKHPSRHLALLLTSSTQRCRNVDTQEVDDYSREVFSVVSGVSRRRKDGREVGADRRAFPIR